jgi:purine-binding chemotaxis protein CheW
LDHSIESHDGAQYLAFRVAGRTHALPILAVREILQFTSATPVPFAPAFLRGLINVRGTAVPVIDLAVRLGMGETPTVAHTCVVVVDGAATGQGEVGVLTEEVERVVSFEPSEIEPPPSFGNLLDRQMIVGLARSEESFVPILAAPELFKIEREAAVAAEAGQDRAPEPQTSAETPPETPPEPEAPKARRRRGKQ